MKTAPSASSNHMQSKIKISDKSSMPSSPQDFKSVLCKWSFSIMQSHKNSTRPINFYQNKKNSSTISPQAQPSHSKSDKKTQSKGLGNSVDRTTQKLLKSWNHIPYELVSVSIEWWMVFTALIFPKMGASRPNSSFILYLVDTIIYPLNQ